MSWLPLLVKASYFVAALLFILGIKRMASPKTAASGIRWAGAGMLVATVATFFLPDMHNVPLILAAVVLGTVVAWWSGKRVAMTDMPQMVALYNGLGGGSAAAIGAVELLRFSAMAHPAAFPADALGGDALAAGSPAAFAVPATVLAVVGALIGSISRGRSSTGGWTGGSCSRASSCSTASCSSSRSCSAR